MFHARDALVMARVWRPQMLNGPTMRYSVFEIRNSVIPLVAKLASRKRKLMLTVKKATISILPVVGALLLGQAATFPNLAPWYADLVKPSFNPPNCGQLLDAEQSFQQSLGLDPLNPDTLHEYSLLLAGTGQLKAAMAMREKLKAIEPLVLTFNGFTILIHTLVGDYARALPMAQALLRESGAIGTVLARLYAAMGRYGDAADAVLTVNPALYPPEVLDAVARLLRMAPASAAQQNIPYLGGFSWVFAHVGLPERVLEQAERARDLGRGNMGNVVNFWSSDFRIARKAARFKTLVREAGLVEYWRAKGWPQYCKPTNGGDFACN